ncbi:AAA family ATPase [Pseudoalteromonas marina]|uniref:AAA family ATPase n=1 Tax=Pseudoalteromonas marina TaxID=267375 RepID=A0ABT9FDY7_9GAMM|nr:AAA family ATPase [Pseudoalteromonas marina]MDP2564971.1 AAA family ATPase [Pseudoalteromonas marina]
MRYVQRTDYFNHSQLNLEKEKYLEELKEYFSKEQYVRPPKYKGWVLKEIKYDLFNEFEHKCAFCETKVMESTAVVEHFRPIGGARRKNGQVDNAYYAWLTLDWENLYLSCIECSKYKGNNFSVANPGQIMMPLKQLREIEKADLIDPCYFDPSQHIELNDRGLLEGITRIGQETIKVLKLNRLNLVERRLSKITELFNYADLYVDQNDPRAKAEIKSRIEDLVSAKGEFSGLLAKFAMRTQNNELRDSIKFFLKLQVVPASVIKRTSKSLAELQAFNSVYFDYIPINQFHSISSIEIKGFKGIKNFRTDVCMLEGKGACYSFLGTNGLGKTTILQAITLALLGAERLNNLDVKAKSRLGLNAKDIIHRNYKEARIKVSFSNNELTNELLITRSENNQNQRVTIFGETDFSPCVLSYGSYRLAAKFQLKDNLSNAMGFRIQSLFNETARLNGIQGIFKRHKNRNSLLAIADILESILGSEGVKFEINQKQKLLIKRLTNNNEFEYINFDVLSAGYKTVVTIVCDILDVLLSVEKQGISSLESTQAFVLIDELDAHLHPSWRLKILQAFRDAFPLVHFYISTHDPLILRSLNEGELLILREDQEDGLVAITDYPSLKGASVDQLLTSDMFGLQTTQDIETENILQDYYKDLERVANESRDAELSTKVGSFDIPKELEYIGNTALTKRERMLMRLVDLEIANHRRDPKYSEWSQETIESLFEKVKDLGMADDF